MDEVESLRDALTTARTRRDALRELCKHTTHQNGFTDVEIERVSADCQTTETSVMDMETRLQRLSEHVATQASASAKSLAQRERVLNAVFSKPPCSTLPDLMTYFLDEHRRLTELRDGA